MKTSKLHYSILATVLTLTSIPAIAQDPFAELDTSTASDTKPQQQEQDEFKKYLKNHQNEFADYKRKLQEEFQEYKKIAQEESDKHRKQLEKVWDKPELSSKKVWVEYSKDLKTKNRVDFANETISISTAVKDDKDVTDKQLREKLKPLLVKNQAQAFRDNLIAQGIEKKSRENLSLIKTAEVKPTPILLPLVSKESKPDENQINSTVEKLIKKKVKKVENNKKGGYKIVTVRVPFDPDTGKPIEKKAKVRVDLRAKILPKKARKLARDVKIFAAKSKLDDALEFAIVETESAFNPMAISPIPPAYGLMQIVPTSAGKDATEKLFGKAQILLPSYLFDPGKNIEVGTTYLNILLYQYLKGVKDPLSRKYCSIAAYSAGHGNVAKAFTGKNRLREALPIINSMAPQQVYDHLMKNLPYAETQQYLEKVVSRIPEYTI